MNSIGFWPALSIIGFGTIIGMVGGYQMGVQKERTAAAERQVKVEKQISLQNDLARKLCPKGEWYDGYWSGHRDAIAVRTWIESAQEPQ